MRQQAMSSQVLMALEGTVEADEQSLVAVNEGDRLLDRPAMAAVARAVVGSPPSDAGARAGEARADGAGGHKRGRHRACRADAKAVRERLGSGAHDQAVATAG